MKQSKRILQISGALNEADHPNREITKTLQQMHHLTTVLSKESSDCVDVMNKAIKASASGLDIGDNIHSMNDYFDSVHNIIMEIYARLREVEKKSGKR